MRRIKGKKFKEKDSKFKELNLTSEFQENLQIKELKVEQIKAIRTIEVDTIEGKK